MSADQTAKSGTAQYSEDDEQVQLQARSAKRGSFLIGDPVVLVSASAALVLLRTTGEKAERGGRL